MSLEVDLKEIYLNRDSIFAIVDDDVYDWAKGYVWWASRRQKSEKYVAYRQTSRADGRKTILMHREIMDVGANDYIDHIDGNSLNNLRENLRVCTPRQNAKNVVRPITNSSGYKGVSWHKDHDAWRAAICSDGVMYNLGFYETARMAGIAYNRAARDLHKEFANYNDIENWENIVPDCYHRPKDRSKHTSQYRGVSYDKNRAAWIARITINKNVVRLGSFSDEIEAARAYDRAIILFQQALHRLNLPHEHS